MTTKAKTKTRKTKPVAVAETASVVEKAPISFTPVLCLLGDGTPHVWSLTSRERLLRQFSKEGLTETLDEEKAAAHHGPVILVRADAVIDQPLIPILLKRPSFMLLGDDGKSPIAATVRGADVVHTAEILRGATPPSGKLLARTPAQLGNDFWKALRKRETPYAMTVTPENRSAVEWRMFMGTYKGATDLVTKHLWPVPAFHTTRYLAAKGVTPNMVTTVGAIMTALAFWLFLQGQFIPGLIAAWAMTFLDTVDGKLARTTLTSSKWGDVFDHGIDLIHPPFWYIAWAFGLVATGTTWSDTLFLSVIACILGGYVVQRLIEGISIKWLGLEIHIWRPIDTFFRQITARRNPNLILLTLGTLVGQPDWGLLAVAAWTVICLLLHAIQLLQGFALKKRSGPLISWMVKP